MWWLSISAFFPVRCNIKLDKTKNNKKKRGDGEGGRTKGEKSRSSTLNKQTKNPFQIFCRHIWKIRHELFGRSFPRKSICCCHYHPVKGWVMTPPHHLPPPTHPQQDAPLVKHAEVYLKKTCAEFLPDSVVLIRAFPEPCNIWGILLMVERL